MIRPPPPRRPARLLGLPGILGLAALALNACAWLSDRDPPPPAQPSFYRSLAAPGAALDALAAASMISGYRQNNGLPPVVLDIINAQSRIADNPYVFAGRGTGPYNGFSQDKKNLDKKLAGMPHWVNHDLRRTAKTLMVRSDIRPDISERVLGHTIKGVEGTYDQHTTAMRKPTP